MVASADAGDGSDAATGGSGVMLTVGNSFAGIQGLAVLVLSEFFWPKNAASLRLPLLNLIGSVVFTGFWAIMQMVSAEAAASMCTLLYVAFLHTYSYTELLCFVQRIEVLDPMNKSNSKWLLGMRRVAMASLAMVLIGVIGTHDHWMMDPLSPLHYCIADVDQASPFFGVLMLGSLLLNGLNICMCIWGWKLAFSFYMFHKRRNSTGDANAEKTRFVVLTLMLVSFTGTCVSYLLVVVVGVNPSLHNAGFITFQASFVVFDLFLSLWLGIIVVTKLSKAKIDNHQAARGKKQNQQAPPIVVKPATTSTTVVSAKR